MINHWPYVNQLHSALTKDNRFWLRSLVIAGVLLSSLVLPLRFSRHHLILLIGLITVVGAVLVLLRWPPVGLLVIVGSIVLPFNGPSKLNATMIVVALLLGLWLLGTLLQQKVISVVTSSVIQPLIALVLVASLAFLVGQLPWFDYVQHAPMGAQLGALSLFILSVGAFLLMAHWVRDLSWLKRITWMFMILGGVYIVGRLLSLQPLIRLYPVSMTGSMFWTWLVALAFGQSLLNRRLRFHWRLLLGGLVLATAYTAYFHSQGWKSGWVPILVCLVVIIGLRSWKFGLLIIVPGIMLTPELISKLVVTDQYSYSTRIEAWQILVEIIKVNPVLGLGPANYRLYTPLFSIRGYSVQFNSHSQYVDLLAQVGILGLACFLWYFWRIGRKGWQLRGRVPEGFPRAYVYGVLGGLAGTLVAGGLGDWIIPFFYNVNLGGFRASVLPWLFFGGLVALEQIFVVDHEGANLQE